MKIWLTPALGRVRTRSRRHPELPARGDSDQTVNVQSYQRCSELFLNQKSAFVGQLADQPIWLNRVEKPRFCPAILDAGRDRFAADFFAMLIKERQFSSGLAEAAGKILKLNSGRSDGPIFVVAAQIFRTGNGGLNTTGHGFVPCLLPLSTCTIFLFICRNCAITLVHAARCSIGVEQIELSSTFFFVEWKDAAMSIRSAVRLEFRLRIPDMRPSSNEVRTRGIR